MSKPGKSLRNLCKKLGVRLTVKKGKKRIYKSVAVLKRQCSKKKRSKKKLLRGSKYGSKKKQTDKKNSIMNTLGKHKIKIGLGTLGVGGIGFAVYFKRQLEKGSVYMVMIPYLEEMYRVGIAYQKDFTGLFDQKIIELSREIIRKAVMEYFSKFDPTNIDNFDAMEKWVKYNKIEEMFQDTFKDGMDGNESKHINKGEKFLNQNLAGIPIRQRLEILL